MNKIMEEMKKEAERRYGNITPASNKPWEECFTELEGELLFWFNLENKTTKILFQGEV